MSNQVIIHAGLPKCASTTLQLKYFSNHNELFYLGSSLKAIKQPSHVQRLFEELDYFSSPETPELTHDDRYYSSLFYKNDLQKLLSQSYDEVFTSSYLEKYTQEARSDQKVIVSCEGFSVNTLVPAKETAERLKRSFPEAKVFFVLRNPLHWLKSRYIQMFRGIPRKIKAMPSYSDWLRFHLENSDHHQSVFFDLRWDKLLDEYAVLFGRKNVKVLLFEQFLKESETFETELSQFMDVDLKQINDPYVQDHYNATITKGDYLVKRWFSKQLPFAINPYSLWLAKVLFRGKPNPKVESDVIESTLAFVNPILKRVEQEWEVPLQKFGYPLK